MAMCLKCWCLPSLGRYHSNRGRGQQGRTIAGPLYNDSPVPPINVDEDVKVYARAWVNIDENGRVTLGIIFPPELLLRYMQVVERHLPIFGSNSVNVCRNTADCNFIPIKLFCPYRALALETIRSGGESTGSVIHPATLNP